MTRLGHTPGCRCIDCGHDATIKNIEKLERELGLLESA